MDFPSLPVDQKIFSADRIWLFLDYDGTVADFALTPDHIEPDPELIRLIQRLSENPFIRVTMISGRRLEHIRKLLPVQGIWLAGTYGIEFQQPEGVEGYLIPYQEVRPIIEAVKPKLEDILSGKEGFYLEDKGWALAIHARFADDRQAAEVLEEARSAMEAVRKPDQFRILGGHKFIEIGPRAAHK
ncbi:MAG TPA: trehalose-phosphatase, partial [Anaerolineaceae bacterium]|nr:trehalose-phosphatase [Anaerolineaceae bacterium]